MHLRIIPINVFKHKVELIENNIFFNSIKKEVKDLYNINIMIKIRDITVNNTSQEYYNNKPYIIIMNPNCEAVEYTHSMLEFYLNNNIKHYNNFL